MMFLSPGDVQGENNKKLELYVPLNETAMFLRSQGFQHEANIVPKRAERMNKSRKEVKSEQR